MRIPRDRPRLRVNSIANLWPLHKSCIVSVGLFYRVTRDFHFDLDGQSNTMIAPLSNSDKDRSTGNKMSESAAGNKGFFTRLSDRVTTFGISL